MPTVQETQILALNEKAHAIVATAYYATKHADSYYTSRRYKNFVPNLDFSAIQFDTRGRELDGAYFRRPRSADESMLLSTDEKSIEIYPWAINPQTAFIAFVVNSYSGHNFHQISQVSCSVGLPNMPSAAHSKISLPQQKKTALFMGYLYRQNISWTFKEVHAQGNAGTYDEVVKFAQMNIPR